MKQKLKEKLKRTSLKRYSKNNIIFVILIAGAVFNDLVLRKLTLGQAFYWKPIIASMSIIIFISMLALLLPYKKRNIAYISLSVFFGLLNGANYLYHGHYNSYLSLSLVSQLANLKEVGSSVVKSLDFKVLIFMIPTIVLIVTIKRLKRKEFFDRVKPMNRKKELLNPLVIGMVLLLMVSVTLTRTDMSRIAKQWNRPYIVEQWGIYTYTTADFAKNVSSTKVHKIEEAEASGMLKDLINENDNVQSENEYKDIFKGRDVYVIHYESAQTFAMDQEFADGPVTPFFNQMAEEGLYFDNFYPQHSVGTSSDSEFTFSTSLLPINNGTVFMTHANREYLTMQKLLKEEGYSTMALHGNNGDFWNRNTMYNTIGYDRFLTKENYIIDEEIGLGLSDMSFFRQSIEKIKQVKEVEDKPIMAKLITLTNHHPFDDVDKYGEFDVGYLEGTDIGNYLKSHHYADKALESFVKGMDEEGLLENSIIVLYGDHHASIAKSNYERLYNYNEHTGSYYSEEDPQYVAIDGAFAEELKRTPFIIWSKDQKIKQVVSKPTGMLDVLPTLGNMLSIENPYQLGVDIMSVEKNRVIFANGDWLDEDYYYCSGSSKLYSFDGNEEIEDLDIKNINELTERRIELSNDIIENDLIKVFNGMLDKSENVKAE